MHHTKKFVLVLVSLLPLALGSCTDRRRKSDDARPTSSAPAPAPAPAPAADGELSGTVLETMDAAGYTYARLDVGDREVWVATGQGPTKVGQKLTVREASLQRGFHSKTLKRTFDEIYFGMRAAAASPHPPRTGTTQGVPKAAPTVAEPIAKAQGEGARTVAELYAGKAELAGQTVAVRGKVTRFNAAIMGKNWLHLEDGSGQPGSHDITVTTAQRVEVGSTVTVKGVLKADLDFGQGYRYALLIEDATVSE